MTATDTLEVTRPALDQELLNAFRSEMLERRRLRAVKAPVQASDADELVDDVTELREAELVDSGIPDSSAVEAPIGTGYSFDTPKTMVGGYIPPKEESYAYQKVLQIRLHLMATPTIEPTDTTLDEFKRIEEYNLDIVERKKPEKKTS